MRAMLVAGLGGMLLGACHGANCAGGNPDVFQVEMPEISAISARSLAVDEVYSRHPTRALIDFANVEQTAAEPATYRVQVELTGAPERRAIYDVDVSETPDGRLEITNFEKAQ